MDGRAAKKQRTEPRAPVAVTRHSDIAVHTWLHFSAFSSCTRPMLSCSPPSSLERCRITSVFNEPLERHVAGVALDGPVSKWQHA